MSQTEAHPTKTVYLKLAGRIYNTWENDPDERARVTEQRFPTEIQNWILSELENADTGNLEVDFMVDQTNRIEQALQVVEDLAYWASHEHHFDDGHTQLQSIVELATRITLGQFGCASPPASTSAANYPRIK